MTPSTHPLLDVRGVNKRFGGLQALSDVGLRINAGQIYGLIGPNGAGKTTFFNVITGLYPPDSGSFMLDGRPYSPRSVHQVTDAGIARTFQNIRLFGSMTALENVMVGRHIRSRSSLMQTVLATQAFKASEAAIRNKARALLAYVGVEHLADKVARTLSYGDQRRLEIARALATEPKLLALDEPAAGMNPSEKATLRRLLEQIRNDGISILLIEHDVKLVMGLCDQITALDRGREIVCGKPEQVRAHPEFIQAYLGKAHLEPTA
ncbi:MAG: ATP-binding cassette domain-containing protein [Pseudomonas stutzeri]|jgi:branched-chain amino acid transport system ATP-binding protein|uniref:ABC transporter ATP-binding protein n=1 Tax=Hydrogenophaga intermedia TaxID=65786 RepID=UPI001699B24C|nr:ABC transporter ATP-binding protein [Hydrogenophaga intermedia]NIM31110.1 ATP-binding cassette domain-containing protein [Stutzerimonas stutzeri]MCM3563426.1 ABC transporter ATP-binding protein [Hydrogenophaga intermedia]NIM88804.1 ATP-binding cassette domain-containing protein [Stutzerimonas stutzeri]NIN81219.1 ATP-binding cassette domain-containing protein [Stutzerimonas stutzeri]NIP00466.1 ATP-binding cassette domain-containing protein [Stutzerimonas stutzeri]